MKAKELISKSQQLDEIIGKVFQRYDSWNGDSWQFTIEGIGFDEDGGITLWGTGRDNWRNIHEKRSYRFKDVATLMEVYITYGGIKERDYELDHCSCEVTISIFKA